MAILEEVMLQKYTRREFREALEEGKFRTAIIPTGSIEQHLEHLPMEHDIASSTWVAREVALRMVPRGRGSIIFTGATASARGAAGFAAFAGAKHALRALAQSMARELGPKIFTLLMWSLMARWIPTLSANLWPANTNAACHSTAFLNPNTSLTTTGCCTGSHGTPGPSNWICVPIWKTGKSGKQIRTDMLLA